MICAVDGFASLVLIPHVNRQEVHAGEAKNSMYYDNDVDEREQINVSPVNFFVPDTKTYKHFGASTRQKVDLMQGDCLFVPAYYYYQMVGFTHLETTKLQMQNMDMITSFPRMYDDMKHHDDIKDSEVYKRDHLGTVVSLKFQGNSQLLAGFYEAIESKLIK